MSCMKCGRDVYSDQVFCESCLEDMARYPVNPDTPVVLPKRTAFSAAPKKVTWKRTMSMDSQIQLLKHRIRLLTIFLVAMTLIAALLVYPAVKYMVEDHFLPGQNYTSIVSKTSPVETTGAD